MIGHRKIRNVWRAPAPAFALVAAMCLAFAARADNPASATQNPPGAPLSGTLANDATSQISYFEWRDPQQGSFTVEVPSGWSIAGGVAWNTLYSPQQWVKARSPDRNILVFYGDPNILPRMVPNPVYDRAGWTAGRVIRNPAGTAILMEPYRTGEAFAAEFTRRTSCARPASQGNFPLRNETTGLERAMQPFASVIHTTVTAGEYLFSCGRFEGYAHAVTLLAGGAPSTWVVLGVRGFNAAGGAGNYEIGRDVMLRMASSFQIDPAWEAHLQQALGAANSAMVQASHAMEEMMRQSGRRALAAHSRAAQNWSDIILGQQHVCDDLGRCQETTNRCDHVWSLAGSFVCGPSDGNPPDARPWHETHRSE